MQAEKEKATVRGAAAYRVHLSPPSRQLPMYAALVACTVAIGAGPTAAMYLLPASAGLLATVLAALGGMFVGLLGALAIVAVSFSMAEAFPFLRTTSPTVETLTLSAGGIASSSTGKVPWSHVRYFTRACHEDGEPIDQWSLTIHGRRHALGVELAADDASRANQFNEDIGAHWEASRTARNADGSPHYFYAWRIHQTVWTGFAKGPTAWAVLSPFVGIVVTGHPFGALAFAALSYGIVWISWHFMVSHLFMALTGYERDRLYFVHDGKLLDSQHRPLVDLSATAWALVDQPWMLKELRPVLNFMQGRRKRLELVMNDLREDLQSGAQTAFVASLRSRYAERELPQASPSARNS